MMDSKVAYTAVVGLVAVLRLLELRVSSRNIARLKARGAVEAGSGHYPHMVVIHAGWLASCVAEVWLLDRPWLPVLAATMGAVFAIGLALRYWAIRTLGERWSTRVVAVPGEPLVDRGPFRWLRHPNYLGVVLEIASLPLVHSCWLTAVIFEVGNGVVLRRRIQVEEGLLAEVAGRADNSASPGSREQGT